MNKKRLSPMQLFVKAVLLGTGFGFLLTFVMIFLGAGLIASGKAPENWMLGWVLVSITAGAVIGSLLASRICESRFILIGVLVGLSLFLPLFGLGMIISYPNMGPVPAIALLTLCGGIAGALPKALGIKAHPNKRRRK